MAQHRLSFWKTTLAFAAIALAAAASMLGLIVWIWRSPFEASWVFYLGVSLALLVALPVAVVSGLTALGGGIALRRDSLEETAQPYVPVDAREAKPSALRSLLRGKRASLRAGDLVEIRSLGEIMQTLDARGTLNGLPFMPEMAALCGTRARVLRRADKLTDWVHNTGLRRMHGLVLLAGLRCDGSAHGQCQSKCQFRWQEGWLRLLSTNASDVAPATTQKQTDLELLAGFCKRGGNTDTAQRFFCQATELTAGGTSMRMIDPRHFARDLVTGNVRLRPLCVGIAIDLFNRVQKKIGAAVFPKFSFGTTARSPHEVLDLQPGELVRVKAKRLIEQTLNDQGRNRGLNFDREMLRFCGGEYRVLARAQRSVVEATGELRHLSNPCILLDGVVATGEYQAFNPENEYIFWREIWLERVTPGGAASAPPSPDIHN